MSTEPSLTVYTEFESDAREYVARLLDHASELFAAVQSVTIINVETEAKRVERADEAASAVTLIGSERGAAIFKLDPFEALALNYEASKDTAPRRRRAVGDHRTSAQMAPFSRAGASASVCGNNDAALRGGDAFRALRYWALEHRTAKLAG